MEKLKLLRSGIAALMVIAVIPACTVTSGRETAGEYVDDATITAKVKTGLLNELGSTGVSVKTMQGMVQLSGFVVSQQIKSRAGEIASKVTGVQSVKNDLIVR
jgi:osmotically-inducible protein OsmY